MKIAVVPPCSILLEFIEIQNFNEERKSTTKGLTMLPFRHDKVPGFEPGNPRICRHCYAIIDLRKDKDECCGLNAIINLRKD